jgi:hypothetical protein
MIIPMVLQFTNTSFVEVFQGSPHHPEWLAAGTVRMCKLQGQSKTMKLSRFGSQTTTENLNIFSTRPGIAT